MTFSKDAEVDSNNPIVKPDSEYLHRIKLKLRSVLRSNSVVGRSSPTMDRGIDQFVNNTYLCMYWGGEITHLCIQSIGLHPFDCKL